jgi:hypothetical protein
MRLLLDQNLSADVAAALRGRGLDVVELNKGVAITVKSTSIRVHELPLISPGGEEDV